jgi:protein O-mannosyl-transferase
MGVLVLLVTALYVPFLGNPLVFDDYGLFTGSNFAARALSPFGLWMRGPPIFSVAFVQVVWGDVHAHRIVGLACHLACALALYGLIRALLRPASAEPRWQWQAFGGAALFALHPVAVYAAGYIAQRSTVLATLFLLLSLLFYLRGLRSARYSDALVAGLLYALAVLSKENALPGAALALALVPLVDTSRRFALRYTALYWLACFPAAVLMVLMSKGVIGQVYEPYFGTIAAQVAGEGPGAPDMLRSPWLASALAQAGLFWRYVALWLWPRTSEMSIDMRIDFAAYWSVGWLAVLAFFAFAGLALLLLFRRGRVGIAGFGLLYFWVMFLVEFGAVRFQEPFVLYRSYLWAPGLAIAACAVLSRLSWRRLALGAGAALLAVLGWQAHDRLQSFSSGLALWQDAAAKLPRAPVPGGHRPLYELGRELFTAGRADEAARVVESCLALYPRTGECQMARAALYMEAGENERALPHLRTAMAVQPDPSHAQLLLGIALENLGCFAEAKAQYQTLVSHGYVGAKYYIERLDSPGKGLLARRATRPPERSRAECEKLR